MDTERLKKYAALTALKRGKKSELDEIEHQLGLLQDEILEEMSAEGISQARVDTDEGRFTLYPYEILYAKAKDGDYKKACAALVRFGLKDLVERRFNTNKLSAVVREWVEQGLPYPKGFEKYITVTPTYKVGVRRANGK